MHPRLGQDEESLSQPEGFRVDTRKWSWPKSCEDEASAPPRQVMDGSRSPRGEANGAFLSREIKTLNDPDSRGARCPTAFTPP